MRMKAESGSGIKKSNSKAQNRAEDAHNAARVQRLVVADSCHFEEELDPDPHLAEKVDPDPDQH